MHLRSIKLRGFKSFPDPVEVKLERGVAVVVGPNGSGKSNVSDAIVWAAGSLTPSELRAEKPDDVLFGGSQTRQAADHCEVELLFDNTDGAFADLDFSEISIARRLVRGGEGQYLVNRTPVRRTDLTELLADVGLGKSMHSIVSQGKVGQVLASRPDDRRDADRGGGRPRQVQAAQAPRRAEARARRDPGRARAATSRRRCKKRLRPLALQATAAERAEKLAVEIAGLRLRVAQLDLACDRRAAGRRRRSASRRRRLRAARAHEKLTGRPRRARAGRGGALRRGRQARDGAVGAVPPAGRGRAPRDPARVGRGPRGAPAPTSCAEVERDARRAQRRGDACARGGRLVGRGERRATRRQASGQAAERARLAHAHVAAAERSCRPGGGGAARGAPRRARARRAGAGRDRRRPGGREQAPPGARSVARAARRAGRRTSAASLGRLREELALGPRDRRPRRPVARPSSSRPRTRRRSSPAPPQPSATTWPSAPGPPATASPRSSARSPSARASRRPPARLPAEGERLVALGARGRAGQRARGHRSARLARFGAPRRRPRGRPRTAPPRARRGSRQPLGRRWRRRSRRARRGAARGARSTRSSTPSSASVTVEGFGFDPAAASCGSPGETAEARAARDGRAAARAGRRVPRS